MNKILITVIFFIPLIDSVFPQEIPSGDAAKGTKSYDQFEKSEACKSCHIDIYEQWTQAMMSQSYTHHWDEIEYFDLAVAHGLPVDA